MKNPPKCPYIFINIPGERAFVTERALYDSVTKGINIVETTLAKEDAVIDKVSFGGGYAKQGLVKDVWVYTIKHVTPSRNGRNIKGTVRLFNLQQTRCPNAKWKIRDEMIEWGQKCLAAREKAAAPQPTKNDKAIARLERELKKLYAHRPVHPLARSNRSWSWYREADDETEHYPLQGTIGSDRAYWLDWHKQREDRRRIAMIAGWLIRSNITSVMAYSLLKDAGFSVKKLSDLNTYERRTADGKYWSKLYLFASGLTPKREYMDNTPNAEDFENHAKARLEFLEKSREIKSIETQIESIRALAKPPQPAISAESEVNVA